MGSQQVYSEGILHGLPSFPEEDNAQYTAIVAGANGISGAYITRVLAASPGRWKTIYALSRKPPQSPLPPNVQFVPVDFLQAPESIAEKLKGQISEVDYVFFTAYAQPPPKENEPLWSNADELGRVNVSLLTNFLSALRLSNLIPKRFLLQTGGKHYGVHLGPTLTPMQESDPRFLDQPNFYFPQEDALWKWAAENGTEWVITRPGFIIGAVPEAAMSIAYGLALYAAVQKELGRPLEFPGDIHAWEAEKHLSSALLLGHHNEWAVLSPTTADKTLNSSDDCLFTYGKFWPVLAALFGVDFNIPETDESKYEAVDMPYSPPPRGFGPAGHILIGGSFEAWAKETEVQEAWKKLKAEHSLNIRNDPFDNVREVFGLLDGELSGPWGRSLHMGQSRKLGWHGFVDSHDALIATFEELAALKLTPPFKKPGSVSFRYKGYQELVHSQI